MIAFGGALLQAQVTGTGFPWMFSEGRGASLGPGLASGVRPAGSRLASRGNIAMRAEEEGSSSAPSGGGYKMSKAVPFLPVSPALEGYVGEEDGFDPIGMSLAYDIRWLREAELKHCRVAMLAVVGWITTDLGFRVPGEPFANLSTVEAHDA